MIFASASKFHISHRVGAFNQGKAQIVAYSVIVQWIICSSTFDLTDTKIKQYNLFCDCVKFHCLNVV